MGDRAVLFPGQGAQFPGMGKEFFERVPAARAVFLRASGILGYDMERVAFGGENLDRTEYTQPAIVTVSYAILAALREQGFTFGFAAGLSLGEYSALLAAGSLTLEEVLPLVRKRGILMQEAVPPGVGGMCAVLGLSREAVRAVLAEAGGDVWPANFNCPGQIVLSGRTGALARARRLAEERGSKGCVDLPVGAPFHTVLLEPAARALRSELARIPLRPPTVPVVFNVTGTPERDPDTIRDLLVRQVMSPVLFEDSLRFLAAQGVTSFVETGPGSTLKSFVRKSVPGVRACTVDTTEKLEGGEWT